jgi:hypothetical protein
MGCKADGECQNKLTFVISEERQAREMGIPRIGPVDRPRFGDE